MRAGVALIPALLLAGCIAAEQPRVHLDGADGEPITDATTDDSTEPRTDIDTPGETTAGDAAEADVDGDCSAVCKNGGTCQGDVPGAVTRCDCTNTGYMGETCETPVCVEPCENGGRCTYPDYCDCGDTGYEGETCDTPVCPYGCDNGECSEPNVCSCKSGWSGRSCETPVCGEGCLHRGRCVGPDSCDCTDTGHGGKFCQFLLCGGALCPDLSGHNVVCNGANHCEYRRVDADQSWRSDIVWIWIPSGTGRIGTPATTSNPTPSPNEQPVRAVTFATGYFISKFEITTRAYEVCEGGGGGCTTPTVDTADSRWGLNRSANGRSMHPQNGLTWAQARAFCAFIGGRLPSEAEWEYATRGRLDYRRWPWGNSPEPTCGSSANFAPPGIAVGCGTEGTGAMSDTSRVPGASGTGALDMAGNVREWVEDCWHHTYMNAPTDGSAWTTGCDANAYVTRGGGFTSTPVELTTSARARGDMGYHDVSAGGRCAMSLP